MSSQAITELVAVERADVHKAGRLAGHLQRVGDDVLFEYDDAYLEDGADHAPPVAFTLPKVASPVRSTAGAVPAFFAGLLPEGLRLQAVTASTRTSPDDHLTLLLAVGADTIGDVQVTPEGEAPAHQTDTVDLSAPIDDFSDVFAKATSTDPTQLDRIALPGVQVKVSAAMLSTPVSTSVGPAILKLNPPEYPKLVANEHFFLNMAAACGLPVPEHQLATDRRGHSALLVRRFDREITADGVRHLAQEDACQVAGRYPAAKYRMTFQEVATALASAVEVGDGSRSVALRRIMEIAAFSYLIGNGDLHAKNLSIRRAPSGAWEVTPAYDLVSTQPYMRWQDPMALPIYGRANRLRRRWWLDAAERLGLRARAMSRVLDQLITASEPWVDRVDEIGFDSRTTALLRDLIVGRRSELVG